MYGQNSL